MTNENSPTIQRCPHDSENPYTMVRNDLLRDENISPNCRWLISYLLSNRQGWIIKISQIINHVKPHMGRDALYTVLKEALSSGYMMQEEYYEKNLRRVRYFVSETPKFKKFFRRPENQDAGDQDAEKPYDKEETKKEETKKEQQQHISIDLSGPDPNVAVFSEPKKTEKAKVHECLVTLVIPQQDKEEITRMYSEPVVKDAVDWSTDPKNPPKNCLAASLKYACKKELKGPRSKIGEAEKNKSFAMNYDNIRGKYAYVAACNDRVEIVYIGSPKSPEVIPYESLAFMEIFQRTLEKVEIRL